MRQRLYGWWPGARARGLSAISGATDGQERLGACAQRRLFRSQGRVGDQYGRRLCCGTGLDQRIGGRDARCPCRNRGHRRADRPVFAADDGDESAPPQARYVATPNGCFRPEPVRQLGGFDGDAGHDDSDLGLRLLAAGYGVHYTTNAVVRHRNPVAFRELFQHRKKYGERNFTLALKHPQVLGRPEGAAKRKQLRRETLYRVLTNLIKLPLSHGKGVLDGLPWIW